MIEGLRWAGERAFLVELSLEEVVAFAARWAAPPGQVDLVSGARTVLVTFATDAQARRAAAQVSTVDLAPLRITERRTVEIDVVYDGEDLAEVARLTGLSAEQVVAAHTASEWIAAFGGFAPGFAYLTGGDPRLAVPRRDTPRTQVPAGSVALAGEFSAVYPRASPGGWRLIGHTDAPLWDLDRDPPALICPGDRVSFRAVRALARTAVDTPSGLSDRDAAEARLVAEDGEEGVRGNVSGRQPTPGIDTASPSTTSGLAIIAPGPLSLIEDLGRPGHADLGVTASGAFDTRSARAANRLVGNARDAAVIETTLGGLAVRAVGDQVIALAGAETRARVTRGEDEDLVAPGSAFLLRDSEVLALGVPDAGVRSYLAVRGGIDAPAPLGSRSTDRLSGIGPAPLSAGDVLPVAGSAASVVGHAQVASESSGRDPGNARLRIRFGPRDDWFDADERQRLVDATWFVGTDADRVGVRLDPAPGFRSLRSRAGELPSEGLVLGAIQVPPSGTPIVFGPDHPVTGGYPVIAVVADADLPALAQLAPGAEVRFCTT